MQQTGSAIINHREVKNLTRDQYEKLNNSVIKKVSMQIRKTSSVHKWPLYYYKSIR